MPVIQPATMRHLPAIERLGEDALLLRFGEVIDASINARVHALSRQIARSRPAWLLDVVPAYATLALFLDIAAHPDVDLQADAIAWLRQQVAWSGFRCSTVAMTVRILPTWPRMRA
jgi:allophanate hydrolase subunit 1